MALLAVACRSGKGCSGGDTSTITPGTGDDTGAVDTGDDTGGDSPDDSGDDTGGDSGHETGLVDDTGDSGVPDDCPDDEPGHFNLCHADVRIVGTQELAGPRVVEAIDQDGDEIDDLVVKAHSGDHGAMAWPGPLAQGELSIVDAPTIAHTDWAPFVGVSVVGGLDESDHPTWAFGRTEDEDETPGILLVPGPLEGEVKVEDVGWWWEGGENWPGWSLEGALDFTGGGHSDLVVGAPRGTVFAWDLATLEGEDEGAMAGYAVDVADQDGDGLADIIVGAPGSSSRAYVVRGPVTASASLSTADLVFWQDEEDGTGAGVGAAFAGDLDGDGVQEVMVGAPDGLRDGDGWDGNGPLFVAWSPASGSLQLAVGDDILAVEPENDRDLAGRWPLAAGDLDADGVPDIALSANGYDLPVEGAGAAYVIFGSTLLDAR